MTRVDHSSPRGSRTDSKARSAQAQAQAGNTQGPSLALVSLLPTWEPQPPEEEGKQVAADRPTAHGLL